MTKFVRANIDIQHLSIQSKERAQLYARAGQQSPRTLGVVIEPVCVNHMVANLLVAVTLPDAVAEPSGYFGTSVFAAGQVAILMGKKWLLDAGLPLTEVNDIKTAHVAITDVKITYLVPRRNNSMTEAFVRQIHQHALLLGLQITPQRSICHTVYRPALAKNSHSSAHSLAGTALVLDWRSLGRHVCMHILLDSSFLQRKNWFALESWRSAYNIERYEEIFNTVVRGMLRLDGKVQPHPEPPSELYDRLSAVESGLLREHIAGRDTRSYCMFPMCAKTKPKSDAKAWLAARISILSITGIDIRKPWIAYRGFRPRLLAMELIYPGDFSPPRSEQSIRFCRENWAALLGQLS